MCTSAGRKGHSVRKFLASTLLSFAEVVTEEAKWTLPDSTGGQPIVFDADGTLRPSLLGFASTDGGSLDGIAKMWRNTGATLEL